MDSGAGTGCLITVIILICAFLGVSGLCGYGIYINQKYDEDCADLTQSDSARLTACSSACNLSGDDYAAACRDWGDLATKTGDLGTAKTAYARACEKGDQASCPPK